MLLQLLLLACITVGIHTSADAGVKNLFVFGDSYTDEGRLGYLISSGGAAPPPGTVIPTSNVTASGGHSWPYYASRKLGSTTYNYAGK
jgi:hypothetical protein